MDLIVEAEEQVQIALDNLVATGVLQTKNGMDINIPLNPEGESHILAETSVKDIYHAVMDSIKAHENIKTNGGDDVDNDIVIEPCPTCCEFSRQYQPSAGGLKTLSTLLHPNLTHCWCLDKTKYEECLFD